LLANGCHVEDYVLAAAEFDASVVTKVVPLCVATRGRGKRGDEEAQFVVLGVASWTIRATATPPRLRLRGMGSGDLDLGMRGV